jgi:serpin B
MLVILPAEGRFGQVEERLGAALLDEVRGNLLETQVELTMPRFGFETDLKLIDLLEGLGLRLPFDP